jgi:hypothetical protein
MLIAWYHSESTSMQFFCVIDCDDTKENRFQARGKLQHGKCCTKYAKYTRISNDFMLKGFPAAALLILP